MEAIALSFTLQQKVPTMLVKYAALFAALLGAFAFRSHVLVPLSLLVLTLWAITRSRYGAFSVGFFYFIGFTHAVPQAVFGYKDIAIGQALSAILLWWPSAAMIFAVPFALFWSDTKPLTFRAPLLLVTLLLPPFGIFGMGHPVLAAGALFPATGLFGIALIIALSPIYVTSYCWCGLLLSAALICMHGGLQPLTDVSILAIDTDFDSNANKTTHNLTTDWLRPSELRARLLGSAPTASILVLPEEIAGVFTPEILNRWSALARETNKILLVGGDQISSMHPSNAFVAFSSDNNNTLYTQRQPVPFTMWKPWSTRAYPISFMNRSVAKVRGKKLGFLLCYELLIPWTVLQTAAQHPDVIVGATNISYARNTNLYALMELHRKLWASLFELPFIVAHNR